MKKIYSDLNISERMRGKEMNRAKVGVNQIMENCSSSCTVLPQQDHFCTNLNCIYYNVGQPVEERSINYHFFVKIIFSQLMNVTIRELF